MQGARAIVFALAMCVVAGVSTAQAEEPDLDALEAQITELHGAGRFSEAEEIAARVLDIRRETLGPRHPDVGASLNDLALLLGAQGDHTAARLLLEESLDISREVLGPRHPDLAIGLGNLAMMIHAGGDYAAARSLMEESLDIKREVLGPTDLSLAKTLNNLAGVLHAQGDYGAALQMHEESIEIRREALGPRHPDVATSLNHLAGAHQALGDYAAARPLFEESLDISRESVGPRHPDVARTMSHLGVLLQDQGDYAAARSLFQESLEIRREVLGPRHRDVATSMGNLAALLQAQGDYSAARPLMEETLDIRRATLGPRHPRVAAGLGHLASLLKAQGHYLAARPLYEESLGIYRETLAPRHPSVARSANNLALLLQAQGDYSAARPLFEESLDIRREVYGLGHPSVAVALNNLAALLKAQGDYAAARLLFEESLTLLREAQGAELEGPRHPLLAASLNSLASLLHAQGDYGSARPLFEESLDIRREALGQRHPDVATSLNNLGVLLQHQGDYASARQVLEESLDIQREALGPRHPAVASGLSNLAGVFQALGDYPAARPLLEESLEIRREALGQRHLLVAMNLNNLALVRQRQGDFAAARLMYDEGLDISREAVGPRHRSVASALNNLALLHEAQGDAAAAQSVRTEALAIVEDRLSLLDALSEREALAHLKGERRTLDRWLAIHDGLEHARGAWTHILGWKGSLGARQRDARATAELDTDTATARAALTEVRRELARLAFAETAPEDIEVHRERRVELSARAEKLERALLASSAAFRRVRAIQQATPADVCAALPADTALVDFLRINIGGTASYLAFAITNDCTVRRVDLGAAEPIDDAVAGWRAVLSAPNTLDSRVDGRGDAVHELLWTPLTPFLDESYHILLVPDGPLAAVPFAALPTGDGRYLLEDFHVGYLDRANDLLLPQTALHARGALVLGGVDFDGVDSGAERTAPAVRSALAPCVEPFHSLPGTVREAQALATRWRRARRRSPLVTLGGTEATEAAVSDALPDKAIAHLATHGFFATSAGCRSVLEGTGGVGYDPMLLSGLALAGANRPADPFATDDGILTAREVASLDLSGTGLVVLSACETGIGEVRSGQGVLGLRRAFAISGAQALVMTLWSVDDSDAERLMDGLYARVLRRRSLPPSEALREAQLAMLAESRNTRGQGRPGSWAAWVATSR